MLNYQLCFHHITELIYYVHDQFISVNGTFNGEEDEDGELYDDIEIGAPRTGRLLHRGWRH